MASRSYVTVKDIKNTLGITSSTDDILLRNIAEASTKIIENHTKRRFNVERGTKYFAGDSRIWLYPDLLSVSTVKLDEEGTASFDSTLTTSDYILLPLNEYPKTYMEIADTSDYGSFAYGVKKGVEVVGEWGFGDGESSTPYIAESTITSSTASGATSIGVVSTNLAIGQTWLIDSEQFYVKDLSTSTASVVCGINGTSKVAHSASSTIYVYQYPSDIWKACLNLCVAEYQHRDKKGITSERLGDYSYSLDKNSINSILEDSIPNYYRRMKV